jgi:uracil-DNA glycosylase
LATSADEKVGRMFRNYIVKNIDHHDDDQVESSNATTTNDENDNNTGRTNEKKEYNFLEVEEGGKVAKRRKRNDVETARLPSEQSEKPNHGGCGLGAGEQEPVAWDCRLSNEVRELISSLKVPEAYDNKTDIDIWTASERRVAAAATSSIVTSTTETTARVTWLTELAQCFRSAMFARLATFVANERKNYTVYPAPENTFAALTLTPLDTVKVVIVGQDPYHNAGQAHGLCFSVLPGTAIPPSLKNIFQELADDPQVPFRTNQPIPARSSHGHLLRWARQGVLLLNTVLTVRSHQANSHANKGWEAVTDEILRAVDRDCRRTNRGVVFLLWGTHAAKKTNAILSAHPRGRCSRHVIITTSHPSPLGATKTNTPFNGSRCFSRCNDALRAMGYQPIDWNVDD